jgi:hypothetical protein
MIPDELRTLLQQPEGPTLDFKQQWYSVYAKGAARERQKDELIKDILSLANGTVQTAGQTAYLIIGAADEQDAEGHRELFDVGDTIPSPRDILQLVNEASTPPISDLQVEIIDLDEIHVGVITIPPDSALHETIKILKPSDGTIYPVHMVFTRHADSVRNASSQERTAILAAKQQAYAARYMPREIIREVAKPTTPLKAAAIGALSGGFFSAVTAKTAYTSQGANRAVSAMIGMGIVGALIGATLGGLLPSALKNVREWFQSPWIDRILMILFVVLAVGVLQFLRSLL